MAEDAMTETRRRWSGSGFGIRLAGSVVFLFASTLTAFFTWGADANCCDSSGDRAFIHDEFLLACAGLIAAAALFAAVLSQRRRMAVGWSAIAALVYVGWGVSLLVTGYNLVGS
jgi:hypothetical protein